MSIIRFINDKLILTDMSYVIVHCLRISLCLLELTIEIEAVLILPLNKLIVLK